VVVVSTQLISSIMLRRKQQVIHSATFPVSVLLIGHATRCQELREVLVESSIDHLLAEAKGFAEARQHLERQLISVILCPLDLHDGTWQSLLEHTQMQASGKPSVIVYGRLADERLWAEVLNLGGHDVLQSEPVVPDELKRAVMSAHRNCPQVRADT
jgi:DNA-binding NarL/FixJ family response regulator